MSDLEKMVRRYEAYKDYTMDLRWIWTGYNQRNEIVENIDEEYGFVSEISALLDNNAAEIEKLINQYDCLDSDFETDFKNDCTTKIDKENKTIVIEFRQYDDMLGIPSPYMTDSNGNVWRSSNKEDWEKYPEYFYSEEE